MILLQAAGLLATGWVVASMSIVPRLQRQSLGTIASQAFRHSVYAGLWSLAITLSLYLAVSRSIRRDTLRMALRVSATAVWFAPAAILLSEWSPVSFGAALVLVISATRLLYAQWRLIHPESLRAPAGDLPSELFRPPPPPLRLTDLSPSLTAALAIQIGAVTMPLGYPMLGAVMFCWFAAMVTTLSLVSGAADSKPPRSLPRSFLGVLLAVILAAGITIGGLSRHIAFSAESDGAPPGHRGLVHRFIKHYPLLQCSEPGTSAIGGPLGRR